MLLGEGSTTIADVMILAFFFAVGAIGLLIAAVSRIMKGRMGAGIVLAVMFLFVAGAAGAFAAAG